MVNKNVLHHLGSIAILLFTARLPVATAQLPIGSVSDVAQIPCPTTLRLNAHSACYTATVICPGKDNELVTFGVTTPAAPKGTIVLHDGDAGMSPYEEPGITDGFARNYLSAGFQVVQLAWGGAGWEGGATW
jgi:hypothetical protein